MQVLLAAQTLLCSCRQLQVSPCCLLLPHTSSCSRIICSTRFCRGAEPGPPVAVLQQQARPHWVAIHAAANGFFYQQHLLLPAAQGKTEHQKSRPNG
jgi:hypothetical protein